MNPNHRSFTIHFFVLRTGELPMLVIFDGEYAHMSLAITDGINRLAERFKLRQESDYVSVVSAVDNSLSELLAGIPQVRADDTVPGEGLSA